MKAPVRALPTILLSNLNATPTVAGPRAFGYGCSPFTIRRNQSSIIGAVKVAGVRAYRRARRGETVVLPPRRVEITELALVRFAPPDLSFQARVSGGTYLRSLARDVGAALGCGAHLATLTRTAVGPYGLGEAVAPEAVTRQDLRDPAELVADLPRRDLTALERDAVLHGRPLPAAGATGDEGRVALFADGRLLAVAERAGELLKPRVVVAEP